VNKKTEAKKQRLYSGISPRNNPEKSRLPGLREIPGLGNYILTKQKILSRVEKKKNSVKFKP
jgi:hypothetical protein